MGVIEKGVFGVLQITFGIVNYLLYGIVMMCCKTYCKSYILLYVCKELKNEKIMRDFTETKTSNTNNFYCC